MIPLSRNYIPYLLLTTAKKLDLFYLLSFVGTECDAALTVRAFGFYEHSGKPTQS
jgi:hypothetical protein